MKDKNKKVALLLKVMIVAFALVGIWVYFNLVPALLEVAIVNDVEIMGANIGVSDVYRTYLTNAYYGLIALFATTGIPCYIVLFLVWKMADTIQEGKVFVYTNAKRLKWISKLSLLDALLGFIVLIAYWLILNIYSELVYLMMMACFFAFPFALVTWALSYMVEKAADLQIESDYTI